MVAAVSARGHVILAVVAVIGALSACGGAGDEPAKPKRAPAETANLWVTTGAEGTACSATPASAAAPVAWADAPLTAKACTFRQACEASARGQVIRVRPGSYPGQYFGGTRDAATGNNTPPCGEGTKWFGDPTCGAALDTEQGNTPCDVVVKQLHHATNDIVFDGFDVDYGGESAVNGYAVLESGAAGWTFRNGRVGNVVDNKAAVFGGIKQKTSAGVTIENVHFHDVKVATEGVHLECIQSFNPGIRYKRNLFTDCDLATVSLAIGDWWGQEPYCEAYFENNVFAHSTNGGGWAPETFWWYTNSVCDVWVVNNTFEGTMVMNEGEGPWSGVWANNIGGGWDCLPGVKYAGNVGTTCDGAGGAATDPVAAGQDKPQPGVRWADPAKFDFSLLKGSNAIGAGAEQYAPETDFLGNRRCGERPDAGALEYQGDCG